MSEAVETLTLPAQKAVDTYLNKRLVPTGLVGVLLGGIVTWAVQQGANAAAKEAVAGGLQTVTARVIETSTDLDKLRTKAATASEKAEKAQEEAGAAATIASEAAQKAQSALSDLEKAAWQADATRSQVQDLSAVVNRVFQDAASVEVLATLIREHGQGAQDKVVKALESLAGDSAASILVPPGCIVAWPGSLPRDAGWGTFWRECDGAVLKASDYPRLSQAIGSTYGNAGTELVKLPDFRGYFLRGADGRTAGSGNDPDSPRKAGHMQQDEFKSHSHPIRQAQMTLSGEGKGGRLLLGAGTNADVVVFPTEEGGQETRPKNYAVHWVIRIK